MTSLTCTHDVELQQLAIVLAHKIELPVIVKVRSLHARSLWAAPPPPTLSRHESPSTLTSFISEKLPSVATIRDFRLVAPIFSPWLFHITILKKHYGVKTYWNADRNMYTQFAHADCGNLKHWLAIMVPIHDTHHTEFIIEQKIN